MSRRNLIRSVFVNWAQLGLNVAWGIVMVPIYLSFLGTAQYGVWVLINSVVGYYGLLDLGVQPSVVRNVARFIGLKDREGLNETFNTAVLLQCGMGSVALLLSVLMAAVLPRIEGFAAAEHPSASALFLLIGASSALAFVGASFRGALNGAGRFDLSNRIRMVSGSVMNLAYIAVLSSGGGLVGLAAVHLIVTLIEKPVMAVVALRQVPDLRLDLRLFRRSRAREVFRYGFHAFFVNAGERLRFFTDAVVIGAFMPASAVAIFRVGSRPLQLLTNFVRGISRVLTPAASRREAEGSERGVARLLVLGCRSTALFAMPGCLALGIAGDGLLELWLGKGFEESVRVMMVLLPAFLIEAGLAPTGSVLLGTERFRRMTGVSLAEGVANLVISLVLIRPLGLVGVALGTVIPMLVVRLVLIPIHACREARLPLSTLMRDTWGIPLMAGTVATLVAWPVARQLPGHDFVSVATVVGTVGLAYALVALTVMWRRGDELFPRQILRAGFKRDEGS